MSPRRRLFSVPAPPGVLRSPGWKPSGFASSLGLPLHKYLRAPAKCSPPPHPGAEQDRTQLPCPSIQGEPSHLSSTLRSQNWGSACHMYSPLPPLNPADTAASVTARLCTRPRSHKKQTRHSPSHEDTSLHCAQKPRRNALWAPGCSPAPRPAPSDSTAASYRQLFKLKLSHVKSNGKISLLGGTRHSFQG